MPGDEVLVVGGSGFYGRYLVADLLQHTSANIVVASRHPRHSIESNPRVKSVACDLQDYERLQQLVSSAGIVVHCAGPFQRLPLNPLRAAIEKHTHYVDIAEDRQFARCVTSYADQIAAAGITALSGMSVSPAMEALFTAMARPYFDSLRSVRTFAAPDTRKHRGSAMFQTMLYGVGRPFEQPRDGRLRRVYGWSEPEWVTFPPPLGKRLTYLVLEMADLDVLPALFGVGTVEFKAGSEQPLLNQLLNLAAAMRARTGHPRWERYTALVRAFSWLVGRWGKNEGGVIFEIGGVRGGVPRTYRIALMAPQDGGRIPSVLAAIAVEEILSGQLTARGLLPVHSWISAERLIDALYRRDLQLWWQPPTNPKWQPFLLDELLRHVRR